MDPKVMKALTIADEEYRQARDAERAEKEQRRVLDALSYGRTRRLFDLWDCNGDGTIDFEELFAGLHRYQTAANSSAGADEVEEIAQALMTQDVDGDQALDKEEFAAAMVNYADAMNTDLHELIDFMCVATALGDVA